MIDWGFLIGLAVLSGMSFYLGRIYERAKNDARASAGEGGEVHVVPGECERIWWRGHYYHLTFHSSPKKLTAAPQPAQTQGE